MIRVKLELVPFGTMPPEEIGELEIVNTVDHPNRPVYGNYRATLRLNGDPACTVRVEGHRRLDGILPLLSRVLDELRK